ncbi:MAG: hypothetical protein WCK27_06345 [Verrucomicrobiota bacterium]
MIVAGVAAAEVSPAILELNKAAFFHGREYFVLRSGRAQMVVQADRADLGPAFTWLLFDAQDAKQSARKESAFNFVPKEGFGSSALEVVLGGYPFTALGHRTDTRWVVEAGIPAVEAVWWAGGVRVTERISALAAEGTFRRTVQLEGAHLAGEEFVRLRLHLPPSGVQPEGNLLLQTGDRARLALAVADATPVTIDPTNALLEIGPVTLTPRASTVVETLLLVQVPTGDRAQFVVQARELAKSRMAPTLKETAGSWAAVSSVSTRDRTVPELFDKARFGLAGMISADGTMDAGIFEYGGQWVRDSSNTALGALHAGQFEAAHNVLQHMLTKMITQDGVTMIGGGFDKPDLEQFDQAGELFHLLRCYRDWTGDDSLVRQHRELLLKVVERPLQPQFRDDTGMVHNRREFWERTFEDAYELAYQTYVILALREAAELAPALGAEDRVARWQQEANRIQQAMLTHPNRALVHDGRLIKRRNITGAVADDTAGFPGFFPDVPLKTERAHRLMPDASMALPIALGVVSARSELARRTLDDLEELWNTRWSDGGYDRYHTSGQPDQPGPWPFATTFILRAQHDAGNYERSRRALEWLNTCPGGRAGAWFEEIPSTRMQSRSCGLLPWTSGEVALFVVRHYLGANFEHGALAIRPALYPGSPPVQADLRYRQGRLHLEISGSGPIKNARVNGKKVKPGKDGVLRLPPDFAGGAVVIEGAR